MSQSVRAMLRGFFDYAGLFPPAGLGMAEAVRNYGAYRAGPHSWLLGRFVLPAARLAEFAAAARDGLPDAVEQWSLAVLLGEHTADDYEAIRVFNGRGGAVIDTVEARAADAEAIARLGRDRPPGSTLYVELPAAATPELLESVDAVGARAKIRTGGITAASFPEPQALLGFVARCVASGVAWKATAGLHHAIRARYRLTYEPNAAQAPMFGFLNLAFAAALLYSGAEQDIAAGALLETDAHRFSFGDTASWNGNPLSAAQLEAARAGCMVAIGSCSFEEPVAELQALGLLERTTAGGVWTNI